MEVDKPQAASSKDLPSNSILIAVTEGGEVVFDKENIGITVEQFIAEKVEGFIASAHDVATQEVKGLMEMKEEVKENIRKHFAEVEA